MTFKSRHSKMNVPEIVRQRKKEKLTGQDTAYIALDISVTSHTHTHTHRQTDTDATDSSCNVQLWKHSVLLVLNICRHHMVETQRTRTYTAYSKYNAIRGIYHAGIAPGVGRAFSRVCLSVCLSLCKRSNRKTA